VHLIFALGSARAFDANGNFCDLSVTPDLSAVPSVHPINDDRELQVSIESPSMHVTARSYLTAGVAALGVGALALAPVQPIPHQIALAPERVISTLAVELAASSIDPITPWVETFTTAGANIGTLLEFYMQKPFPILQAIVANLGTYAAELENGQGDLIPEQIWGNVQTFFQAPWSPGAQFDFPVGPEPQTVVKLPGDADTLTPTYISETLPADGSGVSPALLYNGLLLVAAGQAAEPECSEDGDCLVSQLAPLLNFFATNYSGQLLGLLGPLLAPVVVLTRSFTAIGELFQEGDVIGAINELINIPANMTNGVLNGAGFLDLTGIITAIAPLPIEGAKIGLNVGGLLNSVPKDGSLVPDDPNPPTEYSGGIGLDSLAVDAKPLISSPGLPNGWAGSVVGLGQFLGEQLVVTPPAPPPPVAAEPAAAKQAAPLDIPAPGATETPAEEFAPAVVDIPAEESAPTVAEVVAEDPAPAVDDIAEIEAAIEASESEPAGAATPAAEDSGPEAAADSDKSGDDTDRSGGNDRRGAS
jgi:hypothetical protein